MSENIDIEESPLPPKIPKQICCDKCQCEIPSIFWFLKTTWPEDVIMEVSNDTNVATQYETVSQKFNFEHVRTESKESHPLFTEVEDIVSDAKW